MRFFFVHLSFFVFIGQFNARAQTDVQEVISGIIDQVKTVELAKESYDQKLEQLPNESMGSLLLSVTTESAKGKTQSRSYQFNLADIDPHTVVRQADKKMISVRLGVNNDQPFIRAMRDAQVSYVSSLQIVMEDAEKAKSLVYRFQRAISKLPKAEVQWTSLAAAVEWLNNYQSRFGLAGVTFQESFSIDTGHNHKITLNVNSSESGQPDQDAAFEFFPHHLDTRFLKLEATGEEMDVVIAIKRKEKFIKHTLNGELQSFDNRISFPAENLASARQIIKTLEYVGENYSPEEIIWTDLTGTLAWIRGSLGKATLTSKIITITIQEQIREQEIKFDSENFYQSVVNIILENEKGQTEQLEEEFYPWQINPNAIQLKVEGNRLFLALPVYRNQRLVKITKNGLQQPYQAETKIYFDDIYIAEKAVTAFRYIIPETKPPEPALDTIEDVMDLIRGMVADYSDGRSNYRSELFLDPGSYKISFHSFETNRKDEDIELRIEFYVVEDIRGKGIEIGIDNYKMFVPIQIRNDDKFIWSQENDSQKNYADAAKIRFDDSKKAQDFITALEFLKENPAQGYDWKDEKEVTFYISDHVANHTFSKERVDQKWTFSPKDECMITYRMESAKEKSLNEEVFEFNLSDIDSQAMAIEVSFKKMFVVLHASGDEKLIKSYRNGELQNYQDAMRFLVEDAHKGRMVIDGLKYLYSLCQD